MRTAPLKTEIKDGQVVISIGIDTLCHAVEVKNRLLFDEENITISNKDIFAKEIVDALELEDHEGGNTPVHIMLDNAAELVIENGGEGLKYGHEE